jgi:DNA-directed RNA polymerase subunit beta
MWVHAGECLGVDVVSTVGGISLREKPLVAYSREGCTISDAVLVSERLFFDDVFTSVHIER